MHCGAEVTESSTDPINDLIIKSLMGSANRDPFRFYVPTVTPFSAKRGQKREHYRGGCHGVILVPGVAQSKRERESERERERERESETCREGYLWGKQS